MSAPAAMNHIKNCFRTLNHYVCLYTCIAQRPPYLPSTMMMPHITVEEIGRLCFILYHFAVDASIDGLFYQNDALQMYGNKVTIGGTMLWWYTIYFTNIARNRYCQLGNQRTTWAVTNHRQYSLIWDYQFNQLYRTLQIAKLSFTTIGP